VTLASNLLLPLSSLAFVGLGFGFSAALGSAFGAFGALAEAAGAIGAGEAGMFTYSALDRLLLMRGCSVTA